MGPLPVRRQERTADRLSLHLGATRRLAAASPRPSMDSLAGRHRTADPAGPRIGRRRHYGADRQSHLSRDRDHRLSRQWRRARACPGNGGTREPAHHQALRPHPGTPDPGRGGEDHVITSRGLSGRYWMFLHVQRNLQAISKNIRSQFHRVGLNQLATKCFCEHCSIGSGRCVPGQSAR